MMYYFLVFGVDHDNHFYILDIKRPKNLHATFTFNFVLHVHCFSK